MKLPSNLPPVLALVALAAVSAMRAHDPGLSSLSLQLDENRLVAVATFAPADLTWIEPIDEDGDGVLSNAEFQRRQHRLNSLAAEVIEIRAGGLKLEPVSATAHRLELPGNDNIQFEVKFEEFTANRFEVISALLPRLPMGHRQLLTTTGRSGLQDRLISAGDPSVSLEIDRLREGSRPWQTGSGFVLLGIEHILTGYDHLLFLMGLLVVSWKLLPAIRIITAFTVAHSLTLALAALGLVRLPAELVEPLIAITVIYVGVQNLTAPRPGHRWFLTFAFGLVHGLGFAGVLEELLVGRTGGIVIPLISFNLGVELGQLAVAALFLPVLNLLSHRPSWFRCSTVGASSLLVMVGSFWLWERW
jgi:hydrogenase/urease accessory protein HupE